MFTLIFFFYNCENGSGNIKIDKSSSMPALVPEKEEIETKKIPTKSTDKPQESKVDSDSNQAIDTTEDNNKLLKSPATSPISSHNDNSNFVPVSNPSIVSTTNTDSISISELDTTPELKSDVKRESESKSEFVPGKAFNTDSNSNPISESKKSHSKNRNEKNLSSDSNENFSSNVTAHKDSSNEATKPKEFSAPQKKSNERDKMAELDKIFRQLYRFRLNSENYKIKSYLNENFNKLRSLLKVKGKDFFLGILTSKSIIEIGLLIKIICKVESELINFLLEEKPNKLLLEKIKANNIAGLDPLIDNIKYNPPFFRELIFKKMKDGCSFAYHAYMHQIESLRILSNIIDKFIKKNVNKDFVSFLVEYKECKNHSFLFSLYTNIYLKRIDNSDPILINLQFESIIKDCIKNKNEEILEKLLLRKEGNGDSIFSNLIKFNSRYISLVHSIVEKLVRKNFQHIAKITLEQKEANKLSLIENISHIDSNKAKDIFSILNLSK